MLWNGIGINYGHQVSASSYSTLQVESDLSYLRSIGVARIRIAAPTYSDATVIGYCQDMILRAKGHGFYTVWGVSTGVSSGLTATQWSAYKSYVSGTLLTWALQNKAILDELQVGNEGDLQVDGTTLTAATVRSDMRAMATTVKTGGFTGKVSYATSVNLRSPWISEGIGSLDFIAWNSYDTLTNFQAANNAVFSAFGSKTYISEFGCINTGFGDYTDETAWYIDAYNRVASLQSAGFPSGYFFCYRDGSFGLTANTFALVKTDNTPRMAREALGNANQGFSAFML